MRGWDTPRLGLLLFETLLVVARQLGEDFHRAFGARPNALVVRVEVSGEAAMRTCESHSAVMASARAIAMIVLNNDLKVFPCNATVYRIHA